MADVPQASLWIPTPSNLDELCPWGCYDVEMLAPTGSARTARLIWHGEFLVQPIICSSGRAFIRSKSRPPQGKMASSTALPSAVLEARARMIFRAVLVVHYIDGLDPAVADPVENWLRVHGGWLPDPQVLYGDGTPLTQPADEGTYVTSDRPERAVAEALPAMLGLRCYLHGCEDDEHTSTFFRADVLEWLLDHATPEHATLAARIDPRDRSRSPRRRGV